MDGDIYKLDPVLRPDFQSIRLQASVPEEWNVDQLEWWINQKRIGVCTSPFHFLWNITPGLYTISASIRKGTQYIFSEPVIIRVKR
jgi:hypothetical protein